MRLGERDEGDSSGSGQSRRRALSIPETGNIGRRLDG